MDSAMEARQVDAATTGRTVSTIAVLVVDPSDFSRACTVAALGFAGDLAIGSCATIAQCDREIGADLILFQRTDVTFDESDLGAQLAFAAKNWPGAALLVIAPQFDSDEMLATIRAGSQGLLTANTSLECMHGAILLLVNGFAVYPLAAADRLRHAPKQAAEPIEAPAFRFATKQLDTLTKRQQDVLQLLALGFSNRAIAQRLAISESTVKVHIRAIMAQHGATNRTQIVAHFLKDTGYDH